MNTRRSREGTDVDEGENMESERTSSQCGQDKGIEKVIYGCMETSVGKRRIMLHVARALRRVSKLCDTGDMHVEPKRRNHFPGSTLLLR